MAFAIYYTLNLSILFWSSTDLAKGTVPFGRVAVRLC